MIFLSAKKALVGEINEQYEHKNCAKVLARGFSDEMVGLFLFCYIFYHVVIFIVYHHTTVTLTHE